MPRKKAETYTAVRTDIDLDTEVVLDKTSRRVTQKDADEMIAEVQARAGRPSLTAPGTRSPQVVVRLPKDLRAELDARAKAERRRPSALVREAVTQYLHAPRTGRRSDS